MEQIIKLLDILSFLLAWMCTGVAFCTISLFLKPRKHLVMKILSVLLISQIVCVVVFLNDTVNLSFAFLGFVLYTFVFYEGEWQRKITVVLILYPIIIGINFLQQNVSSDIFFAITHANDSVEGWSTYTRLQSTFLWVLSQMARVIAWIGVFLFTRRYKRQIAFEKIEKSTLLIVDSLMLISTVAAFTVIFFVASKNYIVYPFCVVEIIAGLGGITLIAYMSKSEQMKKEAEKLKAQHEYYTEKLRDEERVRSLYHDMKNHLLILEKQNSADTKEMAEDLRRKISDYENYVHTGNEFLDIIIRDKAKKAKETETDFSANINFERGSFIDAMDMSTIFGNALDNALEAQLKIPKNRRMITVKADCVREMLSIVFENNCVIDGNGHEKTTKQDQFLHGFGIRNIKKAVEKYEGECSIRKESGRFAMKIILPLPEN